MSIITIIQDIIGKASLLRDRFPESVGSRVNYACIFCQNQIEFEQFSHEATMVGSILAETTSGGLFQLHDIIDTVAGKLKIIKIRKPDPTRSERGDADFTLADYKNFKDSYLDKPGFSLIQRPNMEMIEYVEIDSPVRVYYSHPTLLEIYGIS